MHIDFLIERISPRVVFKVVAALFIFALISGVLVLVLYFMRFQGAFDDQQAVWGSFGDFIGGCLNPIIGLFALFALFMTLVLQSKELEATRIELKRSATSAELSTRLAVVNALLKHAESWHSLTGKVPMDQIPDYNYWVNERRPALIKELDELYKSAFGG